MSETRKEFLAGLGMLVWGGTSGVAFFRGLGMKEAHNALPGAQHWGLFQKGDVPLNTLLHPGEWGLAEIGVITFIPLALLLAYLRATAPKSDI